MADPMPRPLLPCEAILYRSVFQAQLEEDEVGPAAFLLKPKDEGELSVWRSAAAAWTRLQRVKRVRSLHTGRVRALGLEVTDDPDDGEHAVILGLPSPYESDEAFLAANRIARKLLEMSRPVPPPGS